jgi:hypothetical protein
MGTIIDQQNTDLRQALEDHPSIPVTDNRDLCRALGLAPPPDTYQQNYHRANVEVFVL